MKLPVLTAIATLALPVACNGGDSGEASAPAPPATAFMTQNAQPPEGADMSGEVPRDDYGRPYGYALLGKPLPAFSGPLVGGGTFDSADISGWTLIDVWGIWCSDCMADAPHVAALSRAIAQDPGLDFISIHTPPSAARADEAYGRYGSVEAYFADKGYDYPTLVDEDASLRETLRIAWTPSYLLVSPAGTVEGFRTDLSAAGDAPVKQFLIDIAAVRAGWNPPALDAASLSISPDGAGHLSGPTPFTLEAVEAAFPGLEVVSSSAMTEGETYPVFEVRGDDGATLFVLEPDWSRGQVLALVTRSRAVEGPGGARIGQTRLPGIDGLDRETCRPGLEEYAERLVCGSRPFAWIFSLPGDYEGPVDAAPDEIVSQAVLAEMRYLPPQRGE